MLKRGSTAGSPGNREWHRRDETRLMNKAKESRPGRCPKAMSVNESERWAPRRGWCPAGVHYIAQEK